MNKLPETVESKINELFGAIHNAMDDLKIAGAEANLNGEFAEVTRKNAACVRLQELEAEIKAALNGFYSKPKIKSINSNLKPDSINRTRRPNARLRVTVSGRVIEELTIKDTFVEALRVIGFERVAKLNKKVARIALLAKTPTSGYQNQKLVDGWYVTAHVNKEIATAVLEEIGKELEVSLRVEAIDGASSFSLLPHSGAT